jgi:hypothetical protein
VIGRREFITLLGGAAAAWPLAAPAQQSGNLPTVGFVQRLRELGWIEGRTVAIEYRWGEGRSERFSEIAAEFVRLDGAEGMIISSDSSGPSLASAQLVARLRLSSRRSAAMA